MHKPSLAALLAVGVIAAAPALAADKAVATVNGQAVPQALYDAVVAEQQAKGMTLNAEQKGALREQLITQEVLAQEAKRKGFDKKDQVRLQMDAARQAVLLNAFLSDYVKSHPISDAQIRAEYDLLKTNPALSEFKARHILVEKEEEAKAIIAKLDKGEKMADLAKQSKDPGSKDKGGDLGWSTPGNYVRPFGEAMVGLKKGEYTKTPVKTDFGYHVIQLEDSRPVPFEQVKPQLQQRANQQQIENLVKELRSKAKIN